MKFVCMCQKGNCRSVVLAYLLKKMGHHAIAIGWKTVEPEIKKQLFEWADQIIVMREYIFRHVEEPYQKKTIVFNVGRDIYFKGHDETLIDMLKKYIKRYKIRRI